MCEFCDSIVVSYCDLFMLCLCVCVFVFVHLCVYFGISYCVFVLNACVYVCIGQRTLPRVFQFFLERFVSFLFFENLRLFSIATLSDPLSPKQGELCGILNKYGPHSEYLNTLRLVSVVCRLSSSNRCKL